MKDFIKISLEVFAQIGPYLIVFVLFGYFAKTRKERANKREQEKKQGIIRTHYIVKTERMLVNIFIVAIIFTGGCTIGSIIQKEDLFVIMVFAIVCIISLFGTLNMVMWRLEINGDTITWRSTFGKKRTFQFEDITQCELRKASTRVYVNGKKLFTIDDNIDDEQFMEDIKKRKIPVKTSWEIQYRKKHMPKHK